MEEEVKDTRESEKTDSGTVIPEKKSQESVIPEKIRTENNTEENVVPAKKWRLRVVIPVAVGAILICAYVMTALYYGERFFPGTTVNGSESGNLDAIAVMNRLNTQTQSYQLEVRGRDPKTEENCVLGTIRAQEINLHIAMKESDIFRLIRQQNEWLWPAFLGSKGYTYTLEGVASVDENKLRTILEEFPAFQSKNMKDPENAYIKGYSETEKRYVTEPETKGTKLDPEAAGAAIKAALLEGQAFVDLEEAGCYVEAAIKEDNAQLQKCLEQANLFLETKIAYDWNDNEVLLTGEQIKDWLSLEDGKVLLDEEAVREFVNVNAQNYDTYGQNHAFVTTLGLELSLPSKSYGWRTDREAETEELVRLIGEGSCLDREPIYANAGACKGADDIGNSYVEIDLTHQHLYLYQDGEVQLESDFVSGNVSRGNKTPPGVFGVTYKTRNAVLRGADYETPVKYWMPFNGNIGMHDATWRRAFGGEIYKTNGSHGCINLPLKKAAAIYEYMTKGFPVVCYYYSQEELTALKNLQEQEQEPAQTKPQTPQAQPQTPQAQPQTPQPETPQEQPQTPQPETPQEQPQPETLQEQPQQPQPEAPQPEMPQE